MSPLYKCEKHEDSIVVYEGWACPACEKIEELQEEIGELKDELARKED
jgi:hypothetical protein